MLSRAGTRLLAALTLVTLLPLVACSEGPAGRGSSAPSTGVSGLDPARVIRVVDGDTAVFAVGDDQETVRFIGVDTPESTTEHEPYGVEASRFAGSLLKPGRQVYLEYDVELRDRYGRLLAYVWLDPPTSRSDSELRAHQFNALLLLRGYGQQMTIQPNSKYADLYSVYAREAREQNRGLWALPLDGYGTRGSGSSEQRAAEGSCVGSKRSDKFHYTDCYWAKKISSGNLIVFGTRDAALRAGYVPCKVCRP